jgi:hypothetical protein
MRTLIAISLVAGCSASSPTAVPDALLVECVTDWNATQGSFHLWGLHPNAEVDEGVYYTADGYQQPMRYAVVGSELRLWMNRGKQLVDTGYRLAVIDEDRHATRYELRLAEPVLGVKVFKGVLAKSSRCEPRRD